MASPLLFFPPPIWRKEENTKFQVRLNEVSIKDYSLFNTIYLHYGFIMFFSWTIVVVDGNLLERGLMLLLDKTKI